MQRASFVNPPMAVILDIARCAAALAVVMGHAVQLGIYMGPWPFGILLQHNAVIIFFVLSGLLVYGSAMREGTTLRCYAIARATRILPAATIALAFSLMIHALYGQALYADPMDAHMPSAGELVLTASFLGQYNPSAAPLYNPPIWSLTYEVWFYAIFGAALFLKGWRRWMTVAAGCALAGWMVLLMMPVWLVGVLLARSSGPRSERSAPAFVAATALFALSALLQFPYRFQLFLREFDIDTRLLGFASHAPTDVLMGALLAAMLLYGRPLLPHAAPVLRRLAGPARRLAGASFTLYLTHWPIFLAMHANGLVAGHRLSLFFVMVAIPIWASLLVAPWIEGRIPRWCRAALLAKRPGLPPVRHALTT